MNFKAILTATLSFFICSIYLFSQAPNSINYQAVARDGSGNILANQSLSVRMGVYDGAGGTSKVYEETHSVSTDKFGGFTLKIGKGAVGTGTFSSIDWASEENHLQVEIDAGAGFVNMGKMQFVSVPYAMHSNSMTNVEANTPAGDVEISSNSTLARLHINPEAATANDSSLIFLGEGSNPNLGMGILYDGIGNKLSIYGQQVGTTTDNHLTIERDAGKVTLTKGMEVIETTTGPDPRSIYGNSAPLAFGYISGTTISTDYGISSVTSPATGVYEVTLDNNFSGFPVVLVTAFNTVHDTESPVYTYTAPNKVIVRFVNENNAAQPTNFSILVFGTPQ